MKVIKIEPLQIGQRRLRNIIIIGIKCQGLGDIMDATLLQYGAIGAMLIYFIWKDKSTFEMYKNTMQRMADLLEAIQKEQSELKKDVDEIKKIIK